MNASVKIKSFTITSSDISKAYANGCKKIAKISKDKRITFNVEIINETTIKFNLYTNIDMNGMQRDFCKMCKEFHCSFYINEEYNCNRCNLKSFISRLAHTANVSKAYYKSRLED